MNDRRKDTLEKIRTKTINSFGASSSIIGSDKYILNVVPSPSLMLDYKLGVGGFPYGGMVEVFGGNGLGKTTCIGYGTLANVQREGKLPALIAMEPNFDEDWAFKLHGLDPDLILVQRPDNAEQAFEMLYELVYDTEIDYVLLDSVGAMGASSTQEGGKQKAYGVSSEVTSGLNAVMPRLYKANKGLMILNQQRQGSGGTQTWYESPGGEALKHHALIRIHLKPGSNKYYSTIDGAKVLVGRELKCVFKKNKVSQAASKSAEFDFYNIETKEYGVLGVDRTSDVINTAKVAGVFKSQGSWLEHKVFPKGKVQGVAKARVFFKANPEAFETIRQDVMRVMIRNEIESAQAASQKA